MLLQVCERLVSLGKRPCELARRGTHLGRRCHAQVLQRGRELVIAHDGVTGDVGQRHERVLAGHLIGVQFLHQVLLAHQHRLGEHPHRHVNEPRVQRRSERIHAPAQLPAQPCVVLAVIPICLQFPWREVRPPLAQRIDDLSALVRKAEVLCQLGKAVRGQVRAQHPALPQRIHPQLGTNPVSVRQDEPVKHRVVAAHGAVAPVILVQPVEGLFLGTAEPHRGDVVYGNGHTDGLEPVVLDVGIRLHLGQGKVCRVICFSIKCEYVHDLV